MPKGELFIKLQDYITPVNNSLSDGWVDTYLQWGLSLTDGAISSLMTPPPNKEYIENKSRAQHGKRIVKNSKYVKKDERDLSLEMHITAPDKTTFFDRYNRFCSEVLDYGYIELISVYIPNTVYRLTYGNCTQFREFIQELAKFMLRLNEPNPADRKPE